MIRTTSCYNCENRIRIPGDCHIGCKNPPNIHLEIGAGGDERYHQAQEASTKNKAVVRCIWPGSGMFPLCFDENTVFACHNHKIYPNKEVTC